ncbi:MAG TPA: DUF1579 family protein [Steroidobacteraceae bacterium]|nr:DUF1579 family protein [Steroidobacteraceae bacterium]
MTQTRSESRTKSSQNPKQRSETRQSIDIKALSIFVGEWRAEGEQLAGPVGEAANVTATQRYEWLQGESFLIHRFDGHVGASAASCIEIIGCDREAGNCRAHTFYNNGPVNVWDVDQHDGQWLLAGDWNMSGKSLKVRCTINFTGAGSTMHSRWEYSNDGTQWQVFWNLTARKLVQH